MYVVFEGIDCVGKSTQIELLKDCFKQAIFTAEPGGTELGKHLRELLLNKSYKIDKKAELLLFLADRTQHYDEILKKNQDKLIISDRSFISGIAYANKAFDKNLLFEFNAFALSHFFPQKIIFLKAHKELIKERLSKKKLDSIEKRGIDYFLTVQNELEETLNFLKEKIDFKLLKLNAENSKENLHQQIKEFLQ